MGVVLDRVIPGGGKSQVRIVEQPGPLQTIGFEEFDIINICVGDIHLGDHKVNVIIHIHLGADVIVMRLLGQIVGMGIIHQFFVLGVTVEFGDGYILNFCIVVAGHIIFVGLFPDIVHAPKFAV